MTNGTSTADVVIADLEAAGIDTAFGIPGVHTLDLYRSIARSGLRHVTPRHEQGAAFMADGFARASGRPALCVLISGPGLMNAATAIGQAYSDSVPMVVLASVNERRHLGLGRGELHEMRDQAQALGGIVSSNLRILDPVSASRAVALSVGRIQAARPRPVYLELPLDVGASPAAARSAPMARLRPAGSDPQVLGEAARLLAEAERPLLIVGGGAAGASEQIRRLVDLLKAPVLSSIAGKGIVPDDGPYSLGARLGTEAGRDLLRRSDVVLALGTELAVPDHWADTLPIGGKLIRVDLDPDMLSDERFDTLPVLGDVGHAVNYFLRALAGRGKAAWAGDVAALRRRSDESLLERRAPHLAMLAALRQALPDESLVVTDMTQIAYAGNQAFPARRPRSWIHPVGFGTLGYALPAAIGAKLARPDIPVVALAGDYGFGFSGQELGTAADLRLPLPVLVWNNAALGQIAQDMDRQGIERIGVEITPPRFDHLAAAYGAGFARVAEPAGLGDALATALAADGPTVIEIVAEDGIRSSPDASARS